jgi:hypothetical protein
MKGREAISGMEHEIFHSRKLHKYLVNNPGLVKFAKRAANKRERRKAKRQMDLTL